MKNFILRERSCVHRENENSGSEEVKRGSARASGNHQVSGGVDGMDAAFRGRSDVDAKEAPVAGSLRTNATCSITGKVPSSTKSARPVSRRASSFRGTRA